MRQSLKRARAGVLVLPSLLLAWVSSPLAAAATRPVLALRPGPVDRPLSIAAADFDRDGYDDLAIANFRAGTIQILINQKDGTFAPAPQGPSGVGASFVNVASAGPFDMVVTDLNPEDVDGDSVANTDDNCPNVYNPKDATGVQVDADGNGVGDACEVLRDTDPCDGTGDTTIDSDGDTVPDYAPGMPPVLDNCPRMANQSQQDTDGDGVGDACPFSPDLIIVTQTQGGSIPFGAVRVRLNDGGGGLVGRPSYGSGVAPGKVVVGDFTGDGRPDLTVTVSSVDVLQFLPGQADGIFGLTTVLQAGDGAQGAEAADFNGDGHLDLAVGNRTADSLSIFMNAGTALPLTPTTTVTLTPQSGPVVLLSGMLNADPFADLVVVSQGRSVCVLGPKPGSECDTDDDCKDPKNPGPGTCMSGTGSIQVFTGSASGALTEVQPPPFVPVGARPRAGLLRDLDDDTKLDLAVADFTGGRVLLYSGNGDGTFAAPIVLAGTPAPAALVALHVAGGSAGPPDLAVLDYADNRIDLYQHSTFTPYATSPASPWRGTSSMLLTGADGLAAVDIVLLQQATARLDALSGSGDGTFRAVAPQPLKGPSACPTSPVNATSVIETDLRQNGRPDLAVLDAADGTVTVLTSSPLGVLEEQKTFPAGTGATHISAGAIVSAIDDYDRDCVLNVVDNCPTVFNPCPVADPMCAMKQMMDPCPDAVQPVPPCNAGDPSMLDPVTRQCDSDHNGIGDECQVLSATQGTLDTDADSKADYDPNALITTGGGPDFDRDTIQNVNDNCPIVPNLDQADLDMNGVGDACQTLSGGLTVDPDGDGVPTYDPAQLGPGIPDPVGAALDNCPVIFNPGQEDNNADHVGNACIVAAALDNCTYTSNATQTDANGDGVGDLCAVPPQDLIAASPSANSVTLLAGDGSGSLHPAAKSPLLGPMQPIAGVAGQFALDCIDVQGGGVQCTPRTTLDIAVAAKGMPADPSDGSLTIFKGDDLGDFTPLGAALTNDEPDDLLLAPAQPVCSFPDIPGNPKLRFDQDNKTDTLATVEKGLSQIEIFLPSSQDAFMMGSSSLVLPPAHPLPLPVPPPLVTAQFTDLNQDGRQDIVALSSPVAGQSTITIYFGIGNGLYFTDQTFSPVTIEGQMLFLSSTNVDPDSFFPDVILFSKRDQSPIVLTNTLRERADIDDSGRVDGFDLAILTAAFGSSRGEDFLLNANGTFQQTGPGCGMDYRCQLNSAGSSVPGQNLPSTSGICNFGFDPLTGSYGLGPDVNLDGQVDGEDLALLAIQFGRSLP